MAVKQAVASLLLAVVTLVTLSGVITLVASAVFKEHAERQLRQPKSGHVVPLPCHSHNDYWREIPFISAVEAGCIGIEADLWAFDDQLLVGHTRGALSLERTFSSLYIKPLVEVLRRMNASPNDSMSGLFTADPEQTMVLLVDFKADPDRIWPLFQRDLDVLRHHGWLTYIKDDEMNFRPITIVVTGKFHLDASVEEEISQAQDIFFDAPLARLHGNEFNAQNSFWASSSFRRIIGLALIGPLRDSHIQAIRKDAREAHSRGLRLRYWGLPGWPMSRRQAIWRTLREEGVDIINVDDLRGAAEASHLLEPQKGGS